MTRVRETPELGPSPAFHRCTPTGMHGSTGVVWADQTPFSLKVAALPRDDCAAPSGGPSGWGRSPAHAIRAPSVNLISGVLPEIARLDTAGAIKVHLYVKLIHWYRSSLLPCRNVIRAQAIFSIGIHSRSHSWPPRTVPGGGNREAGGSRPRRTPARCPRPACAIRAPREYYPNPRKIFHRFHARFSIGFTKDFP
jgi:hypothetical protein